MTQANVIGDHTIFDINATLGATAAVVALVFLALGRSLYTAYRDEYNPLALIKTGELIER
jgi:hypothetical protein